MNSWGNSYILCLLLIITFRFTCREKKVLIIKTFIKKTQNIMSMVVCKFFSCFLSLLKAPIVTNSDILPGIYFVFLKIRPGPNLKTFWYRNWTSVKGSEKQLPSKKKFSKFEWAWSELGVKNILFSETILDKVFEESST